jgi:hypothetical protein
VIGGKSACSAAGLGRRLGATRLFGRREARQQVVGPELEVLAKPFDRGISIAGDNNLEEFAMLVGHSGWAHVLPRGNAHEEHFAGESLRRSKKSRAPRRSDHGVVDSDVRLDHLAPSHRRRQPFEPVHFGLDWFEIRSIANDPADGRPFNHLAKGVNVLDIVARERGDPHTAVRLAPPKPTKGEVGKSSADRLATHTEPVRELDFEQARPPRKTPVKDFSSELVDDRLGRGDRRKLDAARTEHGVHLDGHAGKLTRVITAED